ncbi:MAG: hypothetical protein K2P51_09140 [Rhabdochlamydiaceae bacterium]|nr:hypothetical protein [Rhabdochlamydiaceae bacterium]
MLRSFKRAATAVICALPLAGYGETAVSFFLEGDYLCWQAHLGGLESDFGNSTILIDNTGSVAVTKSKETNIDPSFEWTSGFRIAAGALFECSCLELSAAWTDFRNKGTTTSHGAHGITNSGSCHVSLDQVDLALAYRYGNQCTHIKPFLGMRLAQIKENLSAKVITSITVLPSTLATETRRFDDHQHFKGIGPILGFTGDYGFGRGFGVYGLASFGLLYGDYKLDFDDTDSFTPPFSKKLRFITHQHLHRFNCNLDLAVGFYWRTCIAEKIGVELKIAFENHDYFNQSYLGVNRGDLSFNGGVASLKVDY